MACNLVRQSDVYINLGIVLFVVINLWGLLIERN